MIPSACCDRTASAAMEISGRINRSKMTEAKYTSFLQTHHVRNIAGPLDRKGWAYEFHVELVEEGGVLGDHRVGFAYSAEESFHLACGREGD